MRKIGVCISALLIFIRATAQTSELDPVTITATLQPANSSVTGRNVVVLKGEQFQKLPVHSIDELLRYVPGMEVQMRGPLGSQSDIVLRGGTFQQVLVLVDGIRINDANTGHFNSYIPIAPAQIDRIEVLKGAASAIYGTEAVGGVIHIITKAFAAKQNESKKQLQGQASTGEYGTISANIGGLYQTKNTAIDAGVITNHTNGQQQRGVKGFVHNTAASIGFSHAFNPNLRLSLRSSFDSRHFAAQNFYTTFLSDTAKERITSLWNQAQLSYTKEKHSFSINAGYKWLKDEYQYNNISVANANKSKLLQGLALYNWKPKESTAITAGAQWLNKQITSNDRGNHQLNQVGGFALLHQKVGEHFYINPALRLEWNQRSGTELVPQLNMAYKLRQWQLRASGGKTIRDADFTERYNNNNKALVTGGSIGNPDLVVERSWNYEAGADYYGLKNIKVSATAFQTYFNRLIDYVPTPYRQILYNQNLLPTGTFALAKNIGDITNTGAELDVQYNHQWQGQQFWFTVGLTWIKTSNQQATSFYLSSHANVLVNTSIMYAYKWLQFSANGLYKSRQQRAATAIHAAISKDYFVINSRLAANIYQNKLQVFVQADNLFNRSYSDLLGAVMPGRWVSGGISVNVW